MSTSFITSQVRSTAEDVAARCRVQVRRFEVDHHALLARGVELLGVELEAGQTFAR